MHIWKTLEFIEKESWENWVWLAKWFRGWSLGKVLRSTEKSWSSVIEFAWFEEERKRRKRRKDWNDW
jgi:hypothetical protein